MFIEAKEADGFSSVKFERAMMTGDSAYDVQISVMCEITYLYIHLFIYLFYLFFFFFFITLT